MNSRKRSLQKRSCKFREWKTLVYQAEQAQKEFEASLLLMSPRKRKYALRARAEKERLRVLKEKEDEALRLFHNFAITYVFQTCE